MNKYSTVLKVNRLGINKNIFIKVILNTFITNVITLKILIVLVFECNCYIL